MRSGKVEFINQRRNLYAAKIRPDCYSIFLPLEDCLIEVGDIIAGYLETHDKTRVGLHNQTKDQSFDAFIKEHYCSLREVRKLLNGR